MRALILLTPLLLIGCASTKQPVCAEIPVFEKPKIVMPDRPVLRSTGTKSDAETVRDTHMDMIDLKDYAIQLENILAPLK